MTSNLDALLEHSLVPRSADVEQRTTKLLDYLRKTSQYFGHQINLRRNEDIALAYAKNIDEFLALINHLSESGRIKVHSFKPTIIVSLTGKHYPSKPVKKNTSAQTETTKAVEAESGKEDVKQATETEKKKVLTATKSSHRPTSNKGSLSRIGIATEPAIGVLQLAHIAARVIQDMGGQQGSIFGVFGKWGRGKTYFIEKVAADPSISDKFDRVDFHAWKYQDTPASWAYLYERLAARCFSDIGSVAGFMRTFLLNTKRYGWREIVILVISATTSVIWLFFVDWNIKTKIFSVLVSTVSVALLLKIMYFYVRYKNRARQLLQKYTSKPELIKYLGVQHEIQEEIRFLLKVWPAKGKKVLIVVDDIDRCSEQKIVQIVDSLRVMLDDAEIGRTICVVLAIDESILKRAIQYKYATLFHNSHSDGQQHGLDEEMDIARLTREYLDKLFLSGLRLGNLTDGEKIEILHKYIHVPERLAGSEDAIRSGDDPTTEGNAADSENAVEGLGAERKQALPELHQLEADEVEAMENAVKLVPNITPRQIDILLFRYLLARNILNSLSVEYNPKDLCEKLAKYMTDFAVFEKEVLKKQDGKEQIEKVLEMVVAY